MSSFFNSSAPDESTNYAAGANYELVSTQERLDAVALELAAQPLLAVDTENAGIDPHAKWPLLLQIATYDKCYVFEHFSGLDFSPLKASLENKNIVKIFFQAKYDWKWIKVHYDIDINNIFCCQIAERLLTVGMPGAWRRPALRQLALKYLGIELKKEARSGFIDRDPELFPITEKEYQYSAADVLILPDIYYIQVAHLNKLGIQNAAQLEFDVLPVVALSEVTGVSIDQEQWRSILRTAESEREKLSTKIYECFNEVVPQKTLFGVPTFNIGSNPQLLKHLQKLGFDLDNTEEGTLKRFAGKHEAFDLLLEWRGYEKIRSTYGEKLLSKISKKTNRLHCQFNLVQADTGRMSSEKPNLQNIPGYDPDDPTSVDFRSCFVAKPGYKLVTADFSQQELRILADMSGDPTFRKAYLEKDEDGNTLDVHKYTAASVFGVSYAEVTPKQRKHAKAVNFLLVYGGGAYTLAERLKISEDEAQAIIDNYFKRYDKIKRFLDNCANGAVYNGYSLTISGRKRFLPMPSPDSVTEKEFRKARSSVKRQGKNTPIQGSGADVTKQAMVFVHERLQREGFDAIILMVVHDELVVEVREDQAEQVARIVEEEMIRGFTHFFKNIPMKVDAHIGPTWEK